MSGTRPSEGRLTVCVLGEEPVGKVLTAALESVGHVAIDESAMADLLLLAVKGNELPELVDEITKRNAWTPGQLVAHTAGEFGHTALIAAAQAGSVPLAIHPAMHFGLETAGQHRDESAVLASDLVRLRESYFAVDAPEPALPIAQALVIDMGAEPIVVTEANRAKYFEAWSVASNFSAMVVNQAIGILEEIGIEHAREVVAPIVRSSIDQALAVGHQPIDPEELLN